MWQSAIPSRFVAEQPPEHIERASDVVGLDPGESSVRSRLRKRLGEVRADGGTLPAPVERAFRCGDRRSHAGGRRALQLTAPARVCSTRKFGYGEVIAADGDKLDIDFDKAGTKKVDRQASSCPPNRRADRPA